MSQSAHQFDISKPEARKVFLGDRILFLALYTMLTAKNLEHNPIRFWRPLGAIYFPGKIFGVTDQYYTRQGIPTTSMNYQGSRRRMVKNAGFPCCILN